MTFNEAYEALRELADGRHFALVYERASYSPTVDITAYIEGVGHGQAHITYQGAIDNMRMKLGEQLIGKADEAPEDNDVEET